LIHAETLGMQFGLLLYEDVEPIDLATVGVLSMARRILPEISYVTLGVGESPVRLSNGLQVLTDLDIRQSTDLSLDVVIVPGGPGWSGPGSSPEILDYLRSLPEDTSLVSVCTGAMILAAAGLLDGKAATTKVEVVSPEESPIEVMARRYAAINVRKALLVDEGRVITGAGVSLCIDAMLYVIEKRFGVDQAAEVARVLEYGSARQSNIDRLGEPVGSNITPSV